ncbi:MAG TPA: class I SAM-dependent methyltransferase, partial [Polyangiaceae bacterium]|nr:class I SAM-dependent methyltransferase [Polyangiaceae bacterium]
MVRNVYACLVHEAQECVVDLVRNLRCLDPESAILLYEGAPGEGLLQPRSCFEKLGARVHPSPRPITTSTIHEFALDCLRYAQDELSFETLTVIDSDQLGLRSGWSLLLHEYLSQHRGVGLLGHGLGEQRPERQPPTTRVTPAIGAWQEFALWRPLLQRFPDGESQFPRWMAWPGAVFTATGAREIVAWFDRDAELRRIVAESRMWAKEQIVFPTLMALLGLRVLPTPGSSEYVKYQVKYGLEETKQALEDEDAYWMHPVARRYDDVPRKAIRNRFAQYRQATSLQSRPPSAARLGQVDAQIRQPILKEMRAIEGWFAPAEADLLITLAQRALDDCPQASAIVEVGSYCGRATTVLGGVVRALRATARVWTIDPHDGFVGSLDDGLERVSKPTLETLRQNIERARLSPFVEIIQGRAPDVPWSEPLCLLLIDGLHDYPSVLRDFTHFESHLVDGGLVAFHDYADYFPGVPAFVDELASSGRYEPIA